MSTVLLLVFVLFFNINSISSTTYTCNANSSCGCSALSSVVTSRIVGGEVASNNAWGWMLSLQMGGAHQCGASLLTPEYAVTAGHCAYDLAPYFSELSIVAGTNDWTDTSSSTMQRRSIISMTRHPDYDNDLVLNDIAILQFAPLTMSSDSKLAFICLPKQNQDPFQTNSSLVAIGWGVTKENGTILPHYLEQVTVQVVAFMSPTCNASYVTNTTLEFCAGAIGGGKDTCQGDSGGPLMAFVNNRWVLGGITSTGEGCARKDHPGIYTRVSTYISFIDSIVNFPVTASTIPISETTTIVQQNSITTTFEKSAGNVINISISMLLFTFLVFSMFLF